jgi:hypothetical protein
MKIPAGTGKNDSLPESWRTVKASSAIQAFQPAVRNDKVSSQHLKVGVKRNGGNRYHPFKAEAIQRKQVAPRAYLPRPAAMGVFLKKR